MQQRYSMSWLALEYAHADGGYDDHDVFNCGKAAECMKAVDGTVALRGSIQCVNNHWQALLRGDGESASGDAAGIMPPGERRHLDWRRQQGVDERVQDGTD